MGWERRRERGRRANRRREKRVGFLEREEQTGEIGSLTNLTYIHLSSNYFTEGIPHQIGSLTKLTHLDLSDNFELNGSIPH